METIRFEMPIPEGYEVDIEKSDLKEERVVLKKKEEANQNKLPESWEELGEVSGYYITSNSKVLGVKELPTCNYERNILPSEKLAKSLLEMIQLLQLRDAYNDGWKPDWCDSDEKFCIRAFKGEVTPITTVGYVSRMAFKTKELRDKFLETFRDKLELAKDWL